MCDLLNSIQYKGPQYPARYPENVVVRAGVWWAKWACFWEVIGVFFCSSVMLLMFRGLIKLLKELSRIMCVRDTLERKIFLFCLMSFSQNSIRNGNYTRNCPFFLRICIEFSLITAIVRVLSVRSFFHISSWNK